jgi:murein DD-endopeptidase MepM/ murein hydrolase activator NlpD
MQCFPYAAGVKYKQCGYWGDPRPNGRTHQGIDLCAPASTPILAVADGQATMSTDPLGGRVVGLLIADGSHWYFAHLASWAGTSRAVTAGEVLGWVGSSGDAQANLPHLHLGHYVGGVAVDPTAEVFAAPHWALPTPVGYYVAAGALLLGSVGFAVYGPSLIKRFL